MVPRTWGVLLCLNYLWMYNVPTTITILWYLQVGKSSKAASSPWKQSLKSKTLHFTFSASKAATCTSHSHFAESQFPNHRNRDIKELHTAFKGVAIQSLNSISNPQLSSLLRRTRTRYAALAAQARPGGQDTDNTPLRKCLGLMRNYQKWAGHGIGCASSNTDPAGWNSHGQAKDKGNNQDQGSC